MIEKMNHIYLVCRHSDRESAIDRLGELGIVHVVDVKPPQSEELNQLQAEKTKVVDALNSIREFNNDNSLDENSAPPCEAANGDPHETASEILKLLDEIENAEEKEAHWLAIKEKVEPWGGFSRQTFNTIIENNINLRLCQLPIKSSVPELPEAVMLREINRDKRFRYLLLAAPPGIELPEDLPFFEPPEETELETIENRIQKAGQEQRELTERLTKYAGCRPLLSDYAVELDQRIEFAQARSGMGENEDVCYLQGYVPAAQAETLHREARRQGWGLLIQEASEDDTQVPTKIKLARWAEPIRLVFQAMGIMPGYWEIDISAWFMLFLSIFFALLFGDAGYGGLFLATTLILRKAKPQWPAKPFWLMGAFSVTTIIWGVLSGTYFGLQDNLWSPLATARVEALTQEDNVQKLCFFLGAIHLTIAHAWNAVIYGRSLKSLSELAWISVLWGNFMLAQILVLGTEQSNLMIPLYAVGLIGIILFTKPARNPLKVIGGGIAALLLGLINSFVDVVSYIRLFAVGAATVAVAQSFNEMAQGFLPSWTTFLVGALILLLGHGLNIILGFMSVLVHGVRLNVLEFSQHLGLQWKGVPYHPLSKNRETEI